MFLDANTGASQVPLRPDVCVIGAGVAGLILAKKLIYSGLSVWLFESGGLRRQARFDDLNAGRSNLSDYPFQESRLRIFGGTSHLWAGACIELDNADFERRPWIAYSGWPIRLSELKEYYALSAREFGIFGLNELKPEVQRSSFDNSDICTKTVVYGSTINLGKQYYPMIAKSPHLNCCVNATALELFPDKDCSRIERVRFRSRSGRVFDISPRSVVLACGGIENARLMLSSNSVLPKGIGNTNDVLGRYHMEHPIRSVGLLRLTSQKEVPLALTRRQKYLGCSREVILGLTSEIRRREGLLDLHIRAYRYNLLEETEVVKRSKHVMAQLSEGRGKIDELCLDMIAASRPDTIRYVTWHTMNKFWRNARYDHLRLTAFVEEEPDPENRITLAPEKDSNGRPLPYLTYRESDKTQSSINRSMQIMAEVFRKNKLGVLRFDPGDLRHLSLYNKYGLHQMGTTRMADDIKFGVVDRHCKVHGIKNLFVAGSSIFPTAGAANPTWTISALAMRLADSIIERMPHLQECPKATFTNSICSN